MAYERVARAVFETPWFIREAEGRLIAELVANRLEGVQLGEDDIAVRLESARAAQGPRRGARTSGSVAVIPVYGVLMPRANLLAAMSGGTTVESLRNTFREVLADETIGSIVFDVDSPGGAVDGIDELATEIREARGRKPMVAVANTLMASAAYYLAAQADEVVASPSSMLGSIGVYLEHVEFSRLEDQAGITTTIIRRPEAKHEANDVEPLSDTARTHLQQLVDDYYGQFVGAVAKARAVTPATVRAGYGEGRILTARRAVAAGLADKIGTLDETILRMATGKGPTSRISGAEWRLVTLEAEAEPTIMAGPLKSHSTATTDEPWDGPANEARLASEAGPLRAAHAWVDSDVDPDAKASYKFIHHQVSEDGRVGAANTNGCSNGIAVLNGGRGGSSIPDEDRGGVHAHLARHLEDAGKEAPPLKGWAQEAEAALALARAQAERR